MLLLIHFIQLSKKSPESHNTAVKQQRSNRDARLELVSYNKCQYIGAFPAVRIKRTWQHIHLQQLLLDRGVPQGFLQKFIQSGQDVGPEVGQPISTVCKGRSWFNIFHVLMWHDNSGKRWWEVREFSERRPVFDLLIFLWLERERD